MTRGARHDGERWLEVDVAAELARSDTLAPLTVLATLPGWGRTTWMRQVRTHLEASGTGASVWLGSRAAVVRFLAERSHGPVTVFVDDVLEAWDDPLWLDVARALRDEPGTRFVISSLDLPPEGLAAEVRVLDERDLSLTTEQVRELARRNAPDSPPELFTTLPARTLTCATLVRRHVERLGRSGQHEAWPSPDGPLELALLAQLEATGSPARDHSVMLRLLTSARALRRATPEMLAASGIGPAREVAANFARLAAYPFGVVEPDDETGQDAFEWSDRAWATPSATTSDAPRRALLTASLRTTQDAGHVTLPLYYLLELGDLDAAEALVHANLRLFLLATHRVTYQALLDAPWPRLAAHPNLLLLLAELHVRRTGAAGPSAKYLERARELLEDRTATSVFEEYRLACRSLFAAVGLGDRARTREGLDRVTAMLADETATGLPSVATHDDDVRAHLGAELYLPFWAATQTDDHALALRLATLMRTYANPSSPTAIAEHMTALTEEVFCGATGDPSDAQPGGGGHTDPVLLIETGADSEALGFARMLSARKSTSPSRSALEALVLLVQALTGPQDLHRGDIREALDRSSAFWQDGMPSTFLSAAASLAYLALGDAVAARQCLRHAHDDDWFTLTAQAVWHLTLHDPESAATVLQSARNACEAPRARAVTEVLTAVTQAQLGHLDTAVARLESVAHELGGGLVRFALRLVTDDDFTQLTSAAAPASTPLATILTAALDDTRTLRRLESLRLSWAERETVALLRAGYTNPQIAKHRFVTLNTVRTQLRMLFRKLGATNRTHAVARAEQLGLTDDLPVVPPAPER